MESGSAKRVESDLHPLVVIVGETAAGKSALALELAEQFGGEIIAADSRTVYEGMDIGTAKPSNEERQRVRHYGLDVVEPGMHFSAYDFKVLARKAMADISSRGKLPIMVGGTGLYIDAVLYDFVFRTKAEPELRKMLENIPIEELRAKILEAGLSLPENPSNPRHLARLLEGGVVPNQSRRLRPNTLVLGLALDREVLRRRIVQRVDRMIQAGLVDEVRRLFRQYGNVEALRAPGYRAMLAYLHGEVDLVAAKERFVRSDMLLAKRQRTWFKRNKSIHWLLPERALAESVDLITTFLNN